MNHNKITVVINTFKSEDKIYNCLDSINSESKVIIIENSDNINFKKDIEKKYSNVRCFLAHENLGYAKGNNLGLSKVESEYALILNPDAVLDKKTLSNFLITASKIKDFAILGPAKQDEYGTEDHNSEKNQIFNVDQLKGFAMFLNLRQFKDIGFFDENFFIYLEEIDLCRRVIKKNKKIYLDKNIIIKHVGGSSVKKLNIIELEKNRNWHWMWSTFYFHKKHKGFLLALIIILPKLISSFFKIIIYMLILNKEKHSIYVCRLSGIFNSIVGKKSWYRPSID